MNVKEIKTLVGIMEDSSLTALEIEVPDLKLRLERHLPVLDYNLRRGSAG